MNDFKEIFTITIKKDAKTQDKLKRCLKAKKFILVKIIYTKKKQYLQVSVTFDSLYKVFYLFFHIF